MPPLRLNSILMVAWLRCRALRVRFSDAVRVGNREGPSSSPPSWTHVAPVISPLRQSLEIQPASKGFVDLFQVESVAGADGAVHRGAWNAADLDDHHVRHRVEPGAFAGRHGDTKQRSVHAIGRDRTDRYTRVRPVEHVRL